MHSHLSNIGLGGQPQVLGWATRRGGFPCGVGKRWWHGCDTRLPGLERRETRATRLEGREIKEECEDLSHSTNRGLRGEPGESLGCAHPLAKRRREKPAPSEAEGMGHPKLKSYAERAGRPPKKIPTQAKEAWAGLPG